MPPRTNERSKGRRRKKITRLRGSQKWTGALKRPQKIDPGDKTGIKRSWSFFVPKIRGIFVGQLFLIASSRSFLPLIDVPLSRIRVSFSDDDQTRQLALSVYQLAGGGNNGLKVAWPVCISRLLCKDKQEHRYIFKNGFEDLCDSVPIRRRSQFLSCLICSRSIRVWGDQNRNI